MTETAFDVQGQIAQLWIYPVKSCAGIAVQQAVLTRHGLQWDRHWMVVDPQGEFLTQRSHPRMALIRPEIAEEHLLLHFPGQKPLQVPLQAGGGLRRARVWKDTVQAWDLGEWSEAARQWLSRALQTDCALARFDPAQARQANEHWAGDDDAPVHFADGYPLLVLSDAAVEDLNQRLVQAGEAVVDVRRFRPNIVIAGVQAHDEDLVEQLQVQELPGVRLRPCKPCTRCPIPDIDPETGVSGTAVGDAMRAYRQDPRMDGAITFGMNAVVLGVDAEDGRAPVLAVGQTLAGDLQFA